LRSPVIVRVEPNLVYVEDSPACLCGFDHVFNLDCRRASRRRKVFFVRADEKLTAFLELEATIRAVTLQRVAAFVFTRYGSFKIARVLVRFDYIGSFVVKRITASRERLRNFGNPNFCSGILGDQRHIKASARGADVI
jgi:hypothetical protein